MEAVGTRPFLREYNIVSKLERDEIQFFGEPIDGISLSELSSEILECEEPSRFMENEIYQFLRRLKMAYRTRKGDEGAVDDFSAEVLKIMGYEKVGRTVCINMNIRLLMCGHTTRAQTDVCIIGSEEVLLLLQEDKSYISTDDAEAQLIAEAVAAFQYNNRVRRDRGAEGLDEHIFPCIKMCGTHPVFYKVKGGQVFRRGYLLRESL